MARLLLLLAVFVGLYVFFRWLFSQPPRVIWQSLAVLVAIFLLVLVLTGRAHWLTAVFAALLPFIRGLLSVLNVLPLLKRLFGGAGASRPSAQPKTGQASTVQSRYLRMTLDHDSGDIDGEVLQGAFAGKPLNQMSLEDLLQLLAECQDDEDSVAMLQAYLDRVYADTWRQRAGAQGEQRAAGEADAMTRAEALQVLGLDDGVSDEEIVDAHRRLMQKLHPDRGGSSYLAAKINQAKDTLLGKA